MSQAVFDKGTGKPRNALAMLEMEETDAWFEYLKSTRGQGEKRYREVEPWAWARLRQRLRAINAKRRRLERKAS